MQRLAPLYLRFSFYLNLLYTFPIILVRYGISHNNNIQQTPILEACG